MLQEARSLQQSPAYDEYRQRRVVAEHRLARLVQLGIRQARYFGRVKTKFQLYLAATVANLTLLKPANSAWPGILTLDLPVARPPTPTPAPTGVALQTQ